MIKRSDLLALSFYEKSPFTGSDKGMRYRVEKVTDEANEAFFQATVWREPFAFDHTPDEEKTVHREAFSEDGLLELITWMNDEGHNAIS